MKFVYSKMFNTGTCRSIIGFQPLSAFGTRNILLMNAIVLDCTRSMACCFPGKLTPVVAIVSSINNLGAEKQRFSGKRRRAFEPQFVTGS